MIGRLRILLAVLAGLTAMGVGGAALAQCCTPTPPTCCQPPSPPPPPPPPPSNCCQPPAPPPCCFGPSNVNVNVNVNANAQASARASANAGGIVVVGGGGSTNVYVDQPYPTTISNLQVEGMVERYQRVVRVPVSRSRSLTRQVVIQAVCIDDREVPHPASQVRPDRDVLDDYDGELYRCIAGTKLQITVAEYHGQVSFEGGQTLVCQKMEALYHRPGGQVQCRPQLPARDCNERSLLRRYGAGIKILTWIREESEESYREEVVTEERRAESVSGMSLTLDGGVGGRVF